MDTLAVITPRTTTGITTGVQTLDRVVLLVDAVAQHEPCGLADLARFTALPRPTAHRLAVALEQHNLLTRDDAGRFVLGPRLVGWGATAGRGLIDAAQPVLAQLVVDTGESAQLYVREGDRRVCVATQERRSGLRDTVPLGAVMPLTKGSGGTVLLAWADDAARFKVDPKLLATVRRRGWAQSVGEREAGVASVSAPVRDARGLVVAAISVSGPSDRLSADSGRRLAPAVLAAAANLSADVIAE
jgi:DNA-binding IclR family transcriptional regulator